MTREELEFRGQPPYMYTLEDSTGKPEAIVYPDGTFVPVGTSNVGKTITAQGVDYVVTWDGGMPDPMKRGHTKGRLLPVEGPPYIDSLVAFFRHLMLKVTDETEQTAEGVSKPLAGTKKANRPKGKRQTKGAKQAA